MPAIEKRPAVEKVVLENVTVTFEKFAVGPDDDYPLGKTVIQGLTPESDAAIIAHKIHCGLGGPPNKLMFLSWPKGRKSRNGSERPG